MSDGRRARASDFNEDDRLILSMLADNHGADEIAEILGMPLETTLRRIDHILLMLAARSTGQAVAEAILIGLIGPGANRPSGE
ncbi:MAG: hypothetical protein WD904_11015 [Dehalococcoidia bacterium]